MKLSNERLERELSFAEGFQDSSAEGEKWLAKLKAEKARRESEAQA